jgi:Ca2+-binding EF-hand superfamily protein
MRWLLAGTLVLTAVTFVQAQNKPNKPNAGVQLHADIEQILRQQFDRMDKNKDGNIDPEEAAKFFRGPSAKPAPELLNKNQAGGGNPFNDKNLLEPQKPQDKPETNKPAYKPVVKPLDVQFFEAVDSNNDGLVSWDEFSSYFTKAYEEQIREYQRIMHEMQQLSQQLARARGQSARQQIQRQMHLLQQRRNSVTQHFHRLGANGFPRLPRR